MQWQSMIQTIGFGWEYIPWLDDAPIKLGSKTKKEIDLSFRAKVNSQKP
jgi:hypothetical protein